MGVSKKRTTCAIWTLAISILVGVVLTVIVFIGYYVGCWDNPVINKNPMSKATTYEIRFPELNETIYIQAQSWGLGGQHEEIVIAGAPISENDLKGSDETQLIFRGSSTLFYKKSGKDTLDLFVYWEEPIPKEFSSKVKIRQFKIRSGSRASELVDHYEENGLTRVRVTYPD